VQHFGSLKARNPTPLLECLIRYFNRMADIQL
jgi:hypothetical protein